MTVTSWQPAPRSEQAEILHAAAEADRVARPQRYDLDPDRVAAVAARDPEHAARFAPGWREGLEQYLGSAKDDGRLNALGLGMVVSAAIGKLRAGATIARFRDSAPPVRMQPPIVITGGWRTGTTFLFRLLASDPRLRAPLPAELTEPVRVARMDEGERERFIDAAAAAHEALHVLNPELRAIHDSGARLPEECVLALGTDLRNWGFASTTRLDTYAGWLAGEDLSGSYERYRWTLEALDRGDHRRWVLKAPAHTAELSSLVGAFPGAVIVHLHRDIVETIASGASLFATFRSTYSDEVDAADVGRFQTNQTELWLRRALSYRERSTAPDATFIDLAYDELVRDPVTAVRAVYAGADMEPSDVAALVSSFRTAQPRHAHGTHHYSASAFGLDEDELRQRFAFLDGWPSA